jgi:phosphoglycolate phosphatase
VKKLVLFDIDGTLLLTAGAGRRAILGAMAEEIGDASGLGRIRFDGKTDPQIVTELLDMAGLPRPHEAPRIQSICRRYVQLLARELEQPTTRTTLMPGVRPLLESLEANPDVLLGLLTGNVSEGAELKLRAARLDPSSFRVGAYGSDAPDRTSLPPIAAERAAAHFGRVPKGDEVVIIGDTPADIACGVCIEARAVAVATGGFSVSDLTACRPHAVFPDLSDTDRVLEAILQ